ncbi:MAG TPA: PCP reductase family protein [Vicinamibacterales bacterium]|nr:PCP reductase family protein [Vicinamibacterales bacterium]
MKLQTVGPPERGSLSVVYSCPECGYEMAMLTNAYETQVVQSLGVRIGPDAGDKADTTPTSKCPFTAMIPPDAPKPLGEGVTTDGSSHATSQVASTEPASVTWTAAAEARLENVPAFVRPMARTGIERFARENGALEVDEKILDAAREFFGM